MNILCNSGLKLYIFVFFTIGRNSCSSITVASRPLTLSCQCRLYLHPPMQGSIFLPPLACGFTLPQIDHRWWYPLFSFENLGIFLLNTSYFQHLGYTFSEDHYFLHPTLICFYFTLCHPDAVS